MEVHLRSNIRAAPLIETGGTGRLAMSVFQSYHTPRGEQEKNNHSCFHKISQGRFVI
jgi:hypothetical protein